LSFQRRRKSRSAFSIFLSLFPPPSFFFSDILLSADRVYSVCPFLDLRGCEDLFFSKIFPLFPSMRDLSVDLNSSLSAKPTFRPLTSLPPPDYSPFLSRRPNCFFFLFRALTPFWVFFPLLRTSRVGLFQTGLPFSSLGYVPPFFFCSEAIFSWENHLSFPIRRSFLGRSVP